MLPLYVDTAPLIEQFSLTREDVENLLDNIAKAASQEVYRAWEQNAMLSLNSTRQTYLSNLHLIDSGRMEGTIVLDYSKQSIVRMVEEGMSAFDMKPGMLKSSFAKISQTGKRYLTIPFRWATPGALGESTVFNAKMPEPVYDVAKEKSTDIYMFGGLKSTAMRKDEIPQPYHLRQVKKVKIPGTDKKGFYRHKNSIYEGIAKQKSSITGQSSYISFRRVSENSHPNAWIHNGIVARNLASKAISDARIDYVTGKEIDNFLIQNGFS